MNGARPALALAILFGAGCGSPSNPVGPLTLVTVTFAYEAPVAVDSVVQATFPTCVAAVGPTHVHPSWRRYQRIDMAVVGGQWELTLADVPAGVEHRIRISDPNACAINPTGAATLGVRANGVLLTRVVDTPGDGVEPGLAFTAAPGGTVTP